MYCRIIDGQMKFKSRVVHQVTEMSPTGLSPARQFHAGTRINISTWTMDGVERRLS